MTTAKEEKNYKRLGNTPIIPTPNQNINTPKEKDIFYRIYKNIDLPHELDERMDSVEIELSVDEIEDSGTTNNFNTHTGDTDIHYAQSAITISKNQVTGLVLDLDTIDNNTPYIYRVFLTQSGTTAPIAITLIDTISGLTWNRISGGTYTLTKTNAFIENKTVPVSDNYTDINGNYYTIERTNVNTITLKTYASTDLENPVDDILNNQYLNIEIYK